MRKFCAFTIILMCCVSITACGFNEKGPQEDSRSGTESSLSQENSLSQPEASSQDSVTASEDNSIDGSGDSSTGESGSLPEGNGGISEIAPSAAEFLENMCFYLPEFDDVTSLDWHDFIFQSYTGRFEGEGIEVVKVMREDLGFEEHEIKVSQEDVEAYVRLTLGIDMPDYKPAFEDMGEGQTACYYKDGYYYIGVSDFPAYQFTYKGITINEDNKIVAEVTAAFEDQDNVGSVYFELEPADNENGFIILKKIWDIHFD